MMEKVIMSNFSLEATSMGEEHLVPLMRMAFSAACSGNVATHYRIEGDRLELFWNETKDNKELPYPMTADQAIQFVWGWLQEGKIEAEEPNIGDDGSGTPDAFKLKASDYAGEWYMIVRVEKVWRIVHK